MNLRNFQQQLKSDNIEAFLVTRNNMYLNQDVKEEENQLLKLSGFSGSQGYMIVTQKKAWLLVDSRYSIQARIETNEKETEVVDIKSFFPAIIALLKNQNIKTLTCNPWCISVYDWENFAKKGINLVANENILQNVVIRNNNIFEHKIQFTGKSSHDKCLQVANALSEKYGAMLITSADEISWIANLRSGDLEHSPVLRAYGLLSKQGVLTIFADNCSYSNIRPLSELKNELLKYIGQTILIERNFTPQKILSLIPEGVKTDTRGQNPLTPFKLLKNDIEINGFKKAHIRDGIAMVKFLHWFEHNYKGKTEIDIVKKLKEFRTQDNMFFADSFSTIAASGKNAAIVHYNPKENCSSVIQEDTVLLIDSGAHYYDGTTDVTRTIAVGNPSDEIKNAFTQVLKAHIALSSLTFPKDTPAYALDAICRSELWKSYKNYGHGTGHSVGHFLNVHESPFGLSPYNSKFAEENYITSIEPGYYKENEYGIRIENMVYLEQTNNLDFLKFKNLTFVPIDKRLINAYLLSSEEQNWLNNYHKEVVDCLAPYLDKALSDWLKDICSPL